MAHGDSGSLSRIRRPDRAVEDQAWIRSLLARAAVGTLATAWGDQPAINSNLFVYEAASNSIYLHTARKGRTRSNIELNEHVCFGVHEMGRILPADQALEFSVEYAGVVVFGRGSVVTDAVEAERALQLLLDKYAPHLRPGRDYRAITPDEIRATSVYRISIEEWSGKTKQAPADFPGAFQYHPPPAMDIADSGHAGSDDHVGD